MVSSHGGKYVNNFVGWVGRDRHGMQGKGRSLKQWDKEHQILLQPGGVDMICTWHRRLRGVGKWWHLNVFGNRTNAGSGEGGHVLAKRRQRQEVEAMGQGASNIAATEWC